MKVATALIWPVGMVTSTGLTEATVRLEDVSATVIGEGARAGLPAGSVSQTITFPLAEATAWPGSTATLREYGGEPTTPREVVPALKPLAVAVTNA